MTRTNKNPVRPVRSLDLANVRGGYKTRTPSTDDPKRLVDIGGR